MKIPQQIRVREVLDIVAQLARSGRSFAAAGERADQTDREGVRMVQLAYAATVEAERLAIEESNVVSGR
jgi:hypothetical protein